MSTVAGPIRVLRWQKRGHRYVPTVAKAHTFEAPVSVFTGQIVEPSLDGWRVAEHPPPHDPAHVLRWLRIEAMRDQARRDRRDRDRLGAPTFTPEEYQ